MGARASAACFAGWGGTPRLRDRGPRSARDPERGTITAQSLASSRRRQAGPQHSDHTEAVESVTRTRPGNVKCHRPARLRPKSSTYSDERAEPAGSSETTFICESCGGIAGYYPVAYGAGEEIRNRKTSRLEQVRAARVTSGGWQQSSCRLAIKIERSGRSKDREIERSRDREIRNRKTSRLEHGPTLRLVRQQWLIAAGGPSTTDHRARASGTGCAEVIAEPERLIYPPRTARPS